MSNRMDERLWSTLPEEVQDHIVAFLPFPALSRFKVVSKKYNAWIFSEEFIKLCAQLPLREAQVWMTWSQYMAGSYSTGFKVSAGAKLLGSTHEGMLPYFGPQWERHVQAALGCLLFMDCTKRPADRNCGFVHHEVLCDFSTMTCTRLPQPIVPHNGWYPYFRRVMFGQCGEDKGAFKIAIMDDVYEENGEPYFFQVYNSVTQSWKVLHPEATSIFKRGAIINRTFMFDKIFFLWRAGFPLNSCFLEIVVLDTITGKYECAMRITIVERTCIPGKIERPGFILENIWMLSALKLIAANGRLHLTLGWSGVDKEFVIYEVDLQNNRLTKIATYSMQHITWVVVEGHRDCILLSSRKGGNVVYDCCRKTWCELRDCPLFGGGISSNFHFSMENGNEWDARL